MAGSGRKNIKKGYADTEISIEYDFVVIKVKWKDHLYL